MESDSALLDLVDAGAGTLPRLAMIAVAEEHLSQCYTVAVRMLGSEKAASTALELAARAAWWELQTSGRPGAESPLTGSRIREWILRHVITTCVMLQPDPHAARQVEAEGPVARLDAGLASLPTEIRAAIVLRDIAGCTLHETCDALSVDHDTATAWLRRGRTLLRDYLETARPLSSREMSS